MISFRSGADAYQCCENVKLDNFIKMADVLLHAVNANVH